MASNVPAEPPAAARTCLGNIKRIAVAGGCCRHARRIVACLRSVGVMTIRVLLADDHRVLLAALRALLDREADISVVAESDNGEALVQLATETLPDVVIMDINMPGMNGIVATRRLKARHPDIKVIALSLHSDNHFVVEMLNAGAVGYLVKAGTGDELPRAIRAVAQGQTYLSPEVAQGVVEAVRSGGEPGRVGTRLGPREREVLRLLAEGNSSPRIAAELNIAVSTVEVHRRNIMRKLGLHTVAELTKYAIREGLTSP